VVQVNPMRIDGTGTVSMATDLPLVHIRSDDLNEFRLIDLIGSVVINCEVFGTEWE